MAVNANIIRIKVNWINLYLFLWYEFVCMSVCQKCLDIK